MVFIRHPYYLSLSLLMLSQSLFQPQKPIVAPVPATGSLLECLPPKRFASETVSLNHWVLSAPTTCVGDPTLPKRSAMDRATSELDDRNKEVAAEGAPIYTTTH